MVAAPLPGCIARLVTLGRDHSDRAVHARPARHDHPALATAAARADYGVPAFVVDDRSPEPIVDQRAAIAGYRVALGSMMVTDVEITRLSGRETKGASAMLARAFDDSPIFRHLISAARPRASILRSFFGAAIRDALPFGDVLTAHDDGQVVGGAVWLGPGRYPPSSLRQLRQLTGTFKFGFLAPRSVAPSLRYLRVNERVHPKELHWYLGILGVEPSHQGRGIGGRLLRERLESADADGISAYLETDKERNLAYYGRFGFDLVDTLHPDGPDAPPVWTMWREPATS